MTESKSVALPTWRIPKEMGRLMGIEPTYEGVTVLCLNRLTTAAMSYKSVNGASVGIRTPDPRLRRALLYPTELLTHVMERAKGIEPSQPAWKAGTLPLSYARLVKLLKKSNGRGGRI